jgi:hypothetical protein
VTNACLLKLHLVPQSANLFHLYLYDVSILQERLWSFECANSCGRARHDCSTSWNRRA